MKKEEFYEVKWTFSCKMEELISRAARNQKKWITSAKEILILHKPIYLTVDLITLQIVDSIR
jgi:hypothetical protein